MRPIEDIIDDNFEGTGFRVFNVGDAPVETSVENNTFDVRILELFTSTSQISNFSKSFNLYPTISDSDFTLTSKDDENVIERIIIYDNSGTLLKSIKDINSSTFTFNLSSLDYRGYIMVSIQSENGLAVKRCYKL